jgi:hypothetical protein
MRMPKKKVRWFVNATTNMPTFAEPLGLITIYFSAIDAGISFAIASLLGAPDKISVAQGRAITSEVASFAVRLRILRHLLRVTKLPGPVKRAYAAAIKSLDRANVARNRILHAEWLGIPAKAKFAMLRTRQGEFDVYPATVRAHATVIRDANEKLFWAMTLHLLGPVADRSATSRQIPLQLSQPDRRSRGRKKPKPRGRRLPPRRLAVPK